MRTLLCRIPLLAAMACLAVAALAQEKKEHVKGADLKYRYAFRRVGSNGSETDIMNWNGNINWDKHARQDELWIGKDDKTYLITDKATLDAFEKAFGPLRDFNLQRGKYMDGYYEARSQQRTYDRQARDLDRQISSLNRRRDKTDDADEKKDIDTQIDDLKKQKESADRQSKDWGKKLDAETKRREDFYKKREDIRSDVYRKIDKLVDDAFAKRLATPGTPD